MSDCDMGCDLLVVLCWLVGLFLRFAIKREEKERMTEKREGEGGGEVKVEMEG